MTNIFRCLTTNYEMHLASNKAFTLLVVVFLTLYTKNKIFDKDVVAVIVETNNIHFIRFR